MRREVSFRVKVGRQHKSTLRVNDKSAEAATHYYDCGLPKCDAMLFGEFLPEYGGSIPLDAGDCWQASTKLHSVLSQKPVLTLTALNSNFTKQQGHAETYVTTGEEIKEYDLGGMW